MNAHYQVSPPSGVHNHYGPPAAHPNGHGSFQATQQQRPGNAGEALNQMNEMVWLQLGHLAELMNNNQLALESYQRVLHFNQWSVDALHAIASILRAEDKYSQAVEYIRTILKVQPANGESWSSLGHCYLMMDELQQAYNAYQSALYNLKDPNEPKLWYGIGILYDRYGSLDHAEEAFSQVMRMAPDFDKANEIYFRLGIIYKQQSKYGESLECFRWIVSNPPAPLNQTDIWFQIGHVYEQQKDFESAKGAYRRVLERDPIHAKVLQQLGWLHHQESPSYNCQEQAIEYLEKSVNADQNDAQSWYLLGRCYMSQHKFPKAYEAYQQAVYRDEKNPTFWCSIGVLYYQINQYRDALDAYSRAIRLNPSISEVWYDLGTLYESCNNQTTDALDAYQRAAQLDPANQHIEARLQLLRNGQPTGMPNQNGAPVLQDVHPNAYQAAAVLGPPGPQWGAAAQSQVHHAQGLPPQLNAGRQEWQRLADIHGGQIQPPHRPVNLYEQRDAARGQPPPHKPSPRPEHSRLRESYHGTPIHRPLTPSPRARKTVPYRAPQSMPPAPPAQTLPPHQPQLPNRITNPNFGGHTLPPAGFTGQPALLGQGPLLPYARMGSPPPEVRPMMDGQQPSPRSHAHNAHYHHQPSAPYHHHPDPTALVNIASGVLAPSLALAAAEAATRTRDRTPANAAPKRTREWEDHVDNGNAQKRNANEESRARLEDSHLMRRGTPSVPVTPIERDSWGMMGGPGPVQGGGTSPDAARRGDEQRRAHASYRLSEVTHHPLPLTSTVRQQHLAAMKDGGGAEMRMEDAPLKIEDQQLQREHERETERERARERSGDRQRERDGDRDRMGMRVEEPAARKMDVDENYDDESDEAGKASAGHGSQKGSRKSASVNSGSGKATPGGGASASGSQNGGFNDSAVAARSKVEVRTWRS